MIWFLNFIPIGYELAAFYAARVIYGAMRTDSVAPISNKDTIDRVLAGALALVGGHLWPLAVPIAIVIWRPKKTPAEIKEENDRMRLRIAELERELGMEQS